MSSGTEAPHEPHVVRVLPAPRDPQGLVDVDALVAALRALGPVHVLETRPEVPGARRWSYLIPRARRARPPLVAGPHDDAMGMLHESCQRLGLSTSQPVDAALPPFTGGLVGAFSYDLARQIERIPNLNAPTTRPLMWLEVAPIVVAVDHLEQKVILVGREYEGDRESDLVEDVRNVSDAIATRANPGATPHDRRAAALGPAGPAKVTSSVGRTAYLGAIREVLSHISAGDCFQVNFTQQLSAPWESDVHALYRALRATSPAPRGAVIDDPGVTLASISPETFLTVDSGSATTRPIKGTRPRYRDPRLDQAAASELAASAKDIAENVMVVDMQRNDLGRVCIPGSVGVDELNAVEGHPTVWHLVSTVTGALRAEVGYSDLLRATFPCGSVTGTPKVRAMQIIEALEPVRRSWYCGAIGFLSHGAAELSVAIRTTHLSNGIATYGTGGGIVADSDPADEYDEALAKAAPFLAAVGADQVAAVA